MICAGLLVLAGCAPQKFTNEEIVANTGSNFPPDQEVLSNFYKLSDSQLDFQQDSLDENRTTLTFQVLKPDGTYVTDLQASDFVVTENKVPVTQFQFSSNSQSIVQTVDIVLAVDVTGSMASTIESAKTRLINFVKTSRDRGYHTRLCLLTFGDYVVQNCNKFYDNDPSDPTTLVQVTELISEITKLKALQGSQDPGGHDWNENPMRALIDASKAPWATNSQRFVILMTDDGFLYSPGNSGEVGSLAPLYPDVLAAIASSQMRIFAATPSLAGYNSAFKGQPGIVEASQGEWFRFSDLISGQITLDTILNRILVNAKTTYSVEYVADTNSQLDPSLPLSKRKIEVTLRPGLVGTVVAQTLQSNLPDGRPSYRKDWKLTDKKIKKKSLHVKINGIEIFSGFKVEDGDLIFDIPAIKGAKITVSFEYEDIKDGLIFTPVILSANEDLNRIIVTLNGVEATPADLVFEKSLEGNWSLSPSDRVFEAQDPYQILAHKGLEFKVSRKSH